MLQIVLHTHAFMIADFPLAYKPRISRQRSAPAAQKPHAYYMRRNFIFTKNVLKKMNFYYPRLSRRNVRCLLDFVQYCRRRVFLALQGQRAFAGLAHERDDVGVAAETRAFFG